MPVGPNERVRCDQCGCVLDADSTTVGCLNCLLVGGGLDSGGCETNRFQHYEVSILEDGVSLHELGRGAMGITYQAVDRNLGSTVALKVINARHSGDPQARARFRREARAAAQLRHPNIASVFHFGETQSGQCFYAMELIEGETLEARVRREGPIGWSLALDVIAQVARALIAAEAQGLIHRDLNPSNIMIVDEEASDISAFIVKVIDFGLAKAAAVGYDESDLRHSSFSGTPGFASPEQLSNTGRALDARSDIYSLGVTFWYALTGRVPYFGKTIEEIRDRQQRIDLPVEQLAERKIPAPLIDLLRRTLAIDPTQRPASARELLEALELCRAKLAHRGGIRPFRKLAALIAVVAIAAAALFALRLNRQKTTAAAVSNIAPSASTLTPLREKSIAVLPLENLSEEKENALFAEGIQDELLSNLSKIRDLKVISRTSVMQYKSGSTRNLREIAQQLGVSNVVEGSVRRAGNRVRISVQLIDAQTDRHLWVQNYDRTLADSITLQDQLATEIAAALGATLSPQEKARVQVKPTNNPAAYDAYLRGRAFAAGSPFDKSSVEDAIQSYQEAVTLDASFVLAWAYLSCAQSGSYWQGHDPSPARLAAAKDAADHALALDPDLPETHLALGYYRYFGQRDFTGGLAEFHQAEQGLPNSADVIFAIALIQRRVGHWDEAIAGLRRTIELDPHDINTYHALAVTYGSLRRFPEALATVDRILAWEPTYEPALFVKARALWATGDLQAVEPLLANPAISPFDRGVQALFQRRYPAAIEMLSSAVAAKTKRGEQSDDEKLLLGLSQERAGDAVAARATYEKAVQDFQRELDKVALGSNTEAELHGGLGLAYAGLGEAASAIAEGQKGMAMDPASKDPWEGPYREERMANIYAVLGDADDAIPILERLLQIPYGFAITPALLRLDPIWDPIRSDPRFQKILAGPEPRLF
jgi:serine/threonine protein kinase/Flp pilus assembly protein TadD